MLRAIRMATAALMVLAVGTLPAVLDRCAESCEAHRNTAADAPTCHHAASAASRISRVPTPCGHDHHAMAAVNAKNPAPGRAFDSSVALDSQSSMTLLMSADVRIRPHSPPNSCPTFDRRPLPLRV